MPLSSRAIGLGVGGLGGSIGIGWGSSSSLKGE